MANAIWPIGIPQLPLSEGYEEKPGANVIRTQMDVGHKARRRFTVAQDPHKMIFEMEQTELATFKTFFTNTIAAGALPFELTHPREGTLAVFVFTDEPNYRNVGGTIWQVGCPLKRIG